MKKFEYRVVLADCKPNGIAPNVDHILRQEYKNGWELAGSSREQYPSDSQKGEQIMLVLKRLIS